MDPSGHPQHMGGGSGGPGGYGPPVMGHGGHGGMHHGHPHGHPHSRDHSNMGHGMSKTDEQHHYGHP